MILCIYILCILSPGGIFQVFWNVIQHPLLLNIVRSQVYVLSSLLIMDSQFLFWKVFIYQLLLKLFPKIVFLCGSYFPSAFYNTSLNFPSLCVLCGINLMGISSVWQCFDFFHLRTFYLVLLRIWLSSAMMKIFSIYIFLWSYELLG